MNVFRPDNLQRYVESIMKLWLQGNLDAHFFIPERFWRDVYDDVQEAILNAEITLCEDGGTVVGFAGTQESFLAGLFVSPDSRGKGCGKLLLDEIKKDKSILQCRVYVKNERAVRFYQREKMIVVGETADRENHDEPEYVMEWRRERI